MRLFWKSGKSITVCFSGPKIKPTATGGIDWSNWKYRPIVGRSEVPEKMSGPKLQLLPASAPPGHRRPRLVRHSMSGRSGGSSKPRGAAPGRFSKSKAPCEAVACVGHARVAAEFVDQLLGQSKLVVEEVVVVVGIVMSYDPLLRTGLLEQHTGV